MEKKILGLIIITVNCLAQTSGDLNPSFSDDGYKTVAISETGDDAMTGLIILENNKIIGTGRTYSQTTGRSFGLCKLNSDGSLDTSFSEDGIQITSFPTNGNSFASIIQDDGKILVCGASGPYLNVRSTIIRYNTDGSLDTSFGVDGRLFISIDAESVLTSIQIQNDSKIVVIGRTLNNGGNLRIIRINTNGTLDLSFDTDGVLDIELSNVDLLLDPTSLIIQPDGKYLIGGETDHPNITYNDNDVFLVRLNTDGTFDNSFGTNGELIINNFNEDEFGDFILLNDNSIILVGSSDLQNSTSLISYEFFMMKLTPLGVLDNSFGTNGILFYSLINESDSLDEYILDIVLGEDGFLYVGGFYNTTFGSYSYKGFVFSMDIYGVSNPNFADNGLLILGSTINKITKIQFDNNNDLIIGGTDTYSDDDFRFAKVFSELSLDIDDIEFYENSVLIYPNPINDNVSFKFNRQLNTIEKIELFDIKGNRIKNFNLYENENQLSFVGVEKGIYFLKVSINSGFKTIKVFKN